MIASASECRSRDIAGAPDGAKAMDQVWWPGLPKARQTRAQRPGRAGRARKRLLRRWATIESGSCTFNERLFPSIFLEPAVEGNAIDIEHFRRARLVAAAHFQNFEDVNALSLLQRASPRL